MYFYENIQSLPLGYQKLLLVLSLMSLCTFASHRCGRPDACGTGFSWCHCGHHRWFHDAVPLGREKPGRESKPIARLNKDSSEPWPCIRASALETWVGVSHISSAKLSSWSSVDLTWGWSHLLLHQVVFTLGRNSKAIMSCPSLAQLEARMCLHQTALQKGKDRTLPPQLALWSSFLIARSLCSNLSANWIR